MVSLSCTIMLENFLSDIFMLLRYATWSPGEIVINFHDPADSMYLFMSGKVDVGKLCCCSNFTQ